MCEVVDAAEPLTMLVICDDEAVEGKWACNIPLKAPSMI